jgi:zeaxanthin glucosyltransferase
MTRFAAVANAGASHQMAMCAIGRELQKLGHEFLLLGTKFQAKQLRVSDIPFQLIGSGRHDPVEEYFRRAKEAGGLPISATTEYMKGMAELLCSELPTIFQREIAFVLADQEEPGAATAADLAHLPYASVCTSLPLNEAADIPPGFLGWSYSPGVLARMRNRFGYSIRNRFVSGVNGVINRYRQRANLTPYTKPDDSFSKHTQITQLVQEFDFPHTSPLPALQYVGPFHRQPLSHVEFPYDRLNGLPLIYASFGTTFGGRTEEMHAIADACSSLPVQLVISLGGATAGKEHFPENAIAVAYAPQLEVLSRAALAITHGGLNTTMEALSLGVPLLAMPIAGDQFGVGSRISYHGVGRALGPRQRSVEDIRAAVSSILGDRQWKTAAQRIGSAISHSGGAEQAAAIIALQSSRG